MNNLNQSNKNIKILPHSFRLKTYPRLTLILGLGAKAQNFSFSLPNSRPNAQAQEEMEELTCHCHLIIIFWISMQHITYTHAYIISKITSSFLSLTLGHMQTHTHSQKSHKLSQEHSRNSLLPLLIISRFLEAFKRIFQANHHLR